MSVIPSASGIRLRESPPVRTEGGLRIGMLARIDPWKGQRVLLDAFAEAFAGTDARLEFAGAAPFGHEDFLAELHARAGSASPTRSCSTATSMMSTRSSRSGRGRPGVHAARAPRPERAAVPRRRTCVVVADEGGPTEWVRDDVNGPQLPARDVHALAAVLRRLDESPALRERLGVEAAATPGLLDDAEVAEAHATFYNEVIEALRRRASAAAVRPRRTPRSWRTATVSSASGRA